MKSSEPLISVVMPLYNHERYVEAAVHSVLGQSYKNFELFIIDDCSKDGSLEQVARIQDERIRVITHNQNLGAHATINKGISLAQGEYISIINSDDLYEKERLEALLKRCVSEDVCLAGTSMVLIDENGKKIESADHWWRQWYDDLVKCYIETQDIYLALLRGNFFITTSNFFFRKSLVDHVGYFQPYRYVHDYDFLFRAVSISGVNVAFYTGEPLLQYRLHGTNSISENPMDANRETFDILVKYGSQQLNGDAGSALVVLSHLQKIRHHIEDAYLAEKSRREVVFEQKLTESENRISDYQNQLNEKKRNLEKSNNELDYLRTEMAKVTATRGYRLEKAMYEIYLKVRSLVGLSGKN